MKAKKEKPAKAPKVKKEKKRKGQADASGDSFAAPAAKTKKAKVPARKAPADVYTLILLLSFLFFTAACVMLYLDINSYN